MSIDNIPQASTDFWKYTLRSYYIAGHVWAQSMIKVQTLPTPEDWGWKFENNKLIPHWIDLSEAAVAMRDLIKCACNQEKGCRGRCKCVQSQLLCTELSVCKRQYERE